jgi:hypothetical protein
MADGGGNNPKKKSSSEFDLSAVYRAVASGQSEEQVRRLIRQCRSQKRREAAVNARIDGETALQAAHRLARGDLVGALLENGAHATQLGPRAHPLAIAIHYGRRYTVSALIRQGHDPNDELAYSPWSTVAGGHGHGFGFCRPIHLCVAPPRRARGDPRPPPQLGCLMELFCSAQGKLDVNERASDGTTAVHWLAQAAPRHRERALDFLLSHGADLEARDKGGSTPIFWCTTAEDTPLVRTLLTRGASANVVNYGGFTPLWWACAGDPNTLCPEMISALLQASSPETRHAKGPHSIHRSAADMLINSSSSSDDGFIRPWVFCTLRKLMAGGVPVEPGKALEMLPMAMERGDELEEELAERPHLPTTWRGHEAMVKLAFDFRDAREADERVRATERRVEELERELAGSGVGTESDEEEDQEEETRAPTRAATRES